MTRIVTDIFDNVFQVLLGTETGHPGGRPVRFKELAFANQFLRWLKVDERFWLDTLKTLGDIDHKIGKTLDEVAGELVAGRIRIEKVGDDQNPLPLPMRKRES